jgi:CheY-like chemotaxis protein
LLTFEGNNAKPVPIPKSVLIIDTDETIVQLIKNHLSAIGVAKVYSAANGAEAWQSLEEHQPSLVIMDWKIPGMSGMALFNRVRASESHRRTPVLAISGTLVRDDFRLLEEFPCTQFLAKPFSRNVLSEDLTRLQDSYEWLMHHLGLINEALRKISRDGPAAIREMKSILKGCPNPLPVALIAAERLRECSYFLEAVELLKQVLKHSPDSVMAMNELGKNLHLLGRHRDALPYLEKAIALSPKNMERLCLAGEVKLNLGDAGGARACFQKALEIDPSHQRANAGLLLARNIDEFVGRKSEDGASVSHNFASLMNTMGITKVRAGDFAGGIEQYRAAIEFIHSSDHAARLSFNIALAYLRWKKPSQAEPWLRRCLEISDGKMIKVKKYLVAIEGKKTGGHKEAASDDFEEAI